MSKQQPKIEWQILDEQSESRQESGEQGFPIPDLTQAPGHSRRGYRLRIGASLVALFVIVSLLWLWQQAQRGLDHVEGDLRNATEAELWAVNRGDFTLTKKLPVDPQATAWSPQFAREDEMLETMQGDSPDSHLQVNLQIIDLDDEWAKAQIVAQKGDGGAAYRQTRFFRHTEQGWQRTSPTAEAWGAISSLESTYFSFHFRQHDAEVMAEAAPQVDALYHNLRLELGLPPNPQGAKPVVDVSPTETPGATLLRVAVAGHYVVPSPDLYLAPATVSNSQLLLQSLALLITRDALNEAITYYGIKQARPHVAGALYLWALWDSDLPLSIWRPEIVQWRLGNAPGLPKDYDEICAMHTLWLSSPALISIPLTCNGQGQSPIAAGTAYTLSKAHLEELLLNIYWPHSNPQGTIQWSPQPGDVVILTTFFESMANRYGRQEVPLFLAALGKHKDWPALNQATFGPSSAEFAEEWHSYLEQKYALAP